LRADQVLDLKAELPPKASLWVDEAYVDFAPSGSSIESAASETEGIYLLKSMSKAYALSGARVAYLVCRPEEATEIRAGVPPWIIGTAAQSAAIAALGDHDYHADRWRETRTMVCALADELQELGLTVIDGYIGAVLIRCPLGKSASSWQAELASLGVIVRTPVGMGEVLGEDYIRIGLTDRELMPKVVDAVKLTLA
jgi:histidinol-phosphate/aromatic aminotransferase/cobyric acid decarboxylase-like protein